MKKLPTLFLICTLIFTGCYREGAKSVYEQDDEMMDLTRELIRIFEKDDPAAFKKIYPNATYFIAEEDYKTSKAIKEELGMGMNMLLEQYDATRKMGISKNIEWDDIRYDSMMFATYETYIYGDTVTAADLTIQFKDGMIPYQVKFPELLYLRGEWLVGNRIEWIGIQPYKIEE